MANAEERRCKATTKAGRPCQVRLVNAAGYCVAHDPERPADMRELGRKSGRSRSAPNPERVPEGLRAFLRANVPPSEVWAALKLALEGQNESARASASKVLMDALSEPREDGQCPTCAQAKAEAPMARAKLAELLRGRAGAAEERLAEKVEERAEVLAQGRLAALKAEHGIPTP